VDLGPIADDDKKDLDSDSKDKKDAEGEEKKKKAELEKLTDMEASALCSWLKDTLGAQKVRDVKITTRLADSPAIITDHESGALRRMLKMLVSDVTT
jgi:HSP90 family molecular chaperone